MNFHDIIPWLNHFSVALVRALDEGVDRDGLRRGYIERKL